MYIHIIILIYDLNSKCLLQFKNMPYILSYFLLNPDFPILVFTLILLGSLVPFVYAMMAICLGERNLLICLLTIYLCVLFPLDWSLFQIVVILERFIFAMLKCVIKLILVSLRFVQLLVFSVFTFTEGMIYFPEPMLSLSAFVTLLRRCIFSLLRLYAWKKCMPFEGFAHFYL